MLRPNRRPRAAWIGCGAALLWLMLGAADCRAIWWVRDKVSSSWTDQPPAPGGDPARWGKAAEQYAPGLILRALNDSTTVYLRVDADGRDGRALLSGAYRQDVTFWFFGPDQKSRAWGLRMPFSRLGPSEVSPPDEFRRAGDSPPGPKLEPELVLPQGVAVSTAALPGGENLPPANGTSSDLVNCGACLRFVLLASSVSK